MVAVAKSTDVILPETCRLPNRNTLPSRAPPPEGSIVMPEPEDTIELPLIVIALLAVLYSVAITVFDVVMFPAVVNVELT